MLVSLPALAMDVGGICILDKEMTQYGEFGCIHCHNYALKISHFSLYKHNDIVSVEGSSNVLYIECLGGMFFRENF